MKRNSIRILFLTLLLLTFGVIFNFSSQNGEASGSLSNKVITKIVNIFPYTKNLSLATKQKIITRGEPIIRKLAHFSIYTAVGIFIMAFMCTFDTRVLWKFLISIFVGGIYAITDEYHQSFVIR